jgi:O-acetyl-ADP-ribose deacetylase (regulator of RNase III)
MAGSLTYVKGDATRPAGDGPKVIPHLVNDIGAWGAGFVLAVSRRWPAPEAAYRSWSRQADFGLGMVQPVNVGGAIWVMNMVGQHGVGCGPNGSPPIRYDALQICLRKVARFASEKGASVHCPKFGTALAGGSWDRIEPLVKKELVDRGLDVIVYLFP